jgi:hypothetical protein
MAKVPPPEHTRWKKGQSGNISGRPKGILTQDEVKAILGRFSRLTIGELETVMADKKTTALEMMVASVIMRAMKDGDCNRLEFLLQRSYGKVANVNENINHDYKEEFDQIPRENILELLRKA